MKGFYPKIVIFLWIAVSFKPAEQTIQRFTNSFAVDKSWTIVVHKVVFNDTIPGDTLLEYRAMYSLKELVPKRDSTSKTDAISSATVAAMLDHVVKGAVYTSYTLWHIIYGPTKREIEKIADQNLNHEILLKLFDSPDLSDKIWALNHFPQNLKPEGEIKEKLLSFISGTNVYLSERALNVLNAVNLDSVMQTDLVFVFSNSGFLQQRHILQKLKDAKQLDVNAAEKLSFELKKLNGTTVKYAIELFSDNKIDNETVCENIAALLENENRFISGTAFKYLQNCNNLNKTTRKNLEKYKKVNL